MPGGGGGKRGGGGGAPLWGACEGEKQGQTGRDGG